MGFAEKKQYFAEIEEDVIRETYLELWSDIFEYAENLNGNWLVSQKIFRNNIIPTAEQNPTKFAKWVDDMVKVSGLRIKSRHLFARSLRFIRRFKSLKKVTKQDLSQAITDMLNAGINDPLYAKRAIRRVKA